MQHANPHRQHHHTTASLGTFRGPTTSFDEKLQPSSGSSDHHQPLLRRISLPVVTLFLVVSLVVAWWMVTTRPESESRKSSGIQASHTATIINSNVRHRHHSVHVQVVMVGDSLLSFAYNDSNVLGSSWSQSVDLILQRVLVGTVINDHKQTQQLQDYWSALLNDTIHNDPFQDEGWASVLNKSRTLLPQPSAAASIKEATTTTTITSAHVAAFDLHGHNSFQISATVEMCLSGHLMLTHPKCDEFLSSLQMGLQTASSHQADEVVFLVYFGSGTNNELLVPGTWFPNVEAQRVVTLMKNFVEFGLLGNRLPEIGPVSGASLRYGPQRISPFTPAPVHHAHLNESMFAGQLGRNAPIIQPLFPLSFAGRRSAFVVGGEVPTVWFFNNKTATFQWHTAKPMPQTLSPFTAVAKAQTLWNRDAKKAAGMNALAIAARMKAANDWLQQGISSSLTYSPAKAFCLSFETGQELFMLTCQYVCGLFTGDFELRRLGAQQTRLFESHVHQLVRNWAHAPPSGTSAGTTVAPSLLPLRRILTTDACRERGGNPFGNGECAMANDNVRTNMADCVHFSVQGARKAALLTMLTFLRDRTVLFN
ncbi:membrane-associated protein, putative [Bodo saltans]|uniref:Membrane-associated protein, putative n=1 Tax=Bodo saltans TaxID=75058 RepID=A0A0S4J5N5_BODSA|nr:membrane-associated protein, putative [Bodo saltans]|eukprot:CUG82957.1 membrane-associated protein, putative [Bodo saltans]